MKHLILLLMLFALSATAQQKQFDFYAVTGDTDTVHISTAVKALSIEWKDGHVELFPYTTGVFPIGNAADIICFDDFTSARYMMLYYNEKHDKMRYGFLQYSNGSGIEFDVIPQKNGKGK